MESVVQEESVKNMASLKKAVLKDDAEVARQLLSQNPSTVNSSNRFKLDNFFKVSVRLHLYDTAQVLVKFGANPNQTSMHTKYGSCNLLEFVLFDFTKSIEEVHSRLKLAKVMLEHGASIFAHGNYYYPEVLLEKCLKSKKIMSTKVKIFPDKYVRFYSTMVDHVEIKILLDFITPEHLDEALYYVVKYNHIDAIRSLLERRNKVKFAGFREFYLLHTAAIHADPATIEILLKNGEKIHERNREGKTALQAAWVDQRKENFLTLLKNGADINDLNNRDRFYIKNT